MISRTLWRNRFSHSLLVTATYVSLVGGPMAGENGLAQLDPETGEPGYVPEATIQLRTEPAATPQQAAIAGGLYGTDGLRLFLLDKATGAATFIGNHGFPPGGFVMGALTFDATGTLYGITTTSRAQLFVIDVSTGASASVGLLDVGFVFEGGLAFDNSGVLLGVNSGSANQSRAFTIDTTTGAATDLGPNPGEGRDLNGMTVLDDAIYALDRVSNTLGNLDETTGAYTQIGNPGVTIGDSGGLAADPADGALYATFDAVGGLYMLDESTAAASLIGTTSVTKGLAFAPLSITPPPPCFGDCNANGRVEVSELVRGVNIVLGRLAVSECSAVDGDSNGRVSVGELVTAVNSALDGCPVRRFEDTGLRGIDHQTEVREREENRDD